MKEKENENEMDCVERAFAKDKHCIEARAVEEEEGENGDEQVEEKKKKKKQQKEGSFRLFFVIVWKFNQFVF